MGTSPMSVSICRRCQRMEQALLGGAQKWEKRQQRETGAQEVPPGREEELLSCEGDCALGQIAQRGWGVPLPACTDEQHKSCFWSTGGLITKPNPCSIDVFPGPEHQFPRSGVHLFVL